MTQSEIVKRIEEICGEFDGRVAKVGLAVARLELAKVVAEGELDYKDMRKFQAKFIEADQECDSLRIQLSELTMQRDRLLAMFKDNSE